MGIDIRFKVIGQSDVVEYKGTIKKSHKIFNERLIGANVYTEFFLSIRKLNRLIQDVKYLKCQFQKLKSWRNNLPKIIGENHVTIWTYLRNYSSLGKLETILIVGCEETKTLIIYNLKFWKIK